MKIKIKSLAIFLLKIVFCYFFIPLSFVSVYFGIIFASGGRFSDNPYTIRAKIIEKSPNSVRLIILKHNLLIDSEWLMHFPPIYIRSVTPETIKYFNDYSLGQTILAKTNTRSGIKNGIWGPSLLDILKVEKDTIDPLGVDFSVIWLITMAFLYAVMLIFLFKNELRWLLRILRKLPIFQINFSSSISGRRRI